MFGWMVSRMLPIIPKPVVKAVASRYVAGEDLAAAVEKVRQLNAKGFEATLDILGEDALGAAHADKTVQGYCDVLDAIAANGLRSNVSIKLTHMGLRLDRAQAEERLAKVIAHADGLGNFVRIDMEDSSLTTTTIEIHDAMKARFPRVGTVIQAYLRRTVDDAKALAARGGNLRLCKGIYREPKAIAFHGKEEIRQSYLAAAEALLTGEGSYVGLATHDRVLAARLVELVERLGTPKDRFEFQALLGVPVDDMLQDFVKRGYKVRLYVPFGDEWYAYSTRRLKENPKVATYVTKALFFGR